MAKKYVPSGYQIIELNVDYDTDNSKYIIEETEDSLLLTALLNGLIKKPFILKKPILLRIFDKYDDISIQFFAQEIDRALFGQFGGYGFQIDLDGGEPSRLEIFITEI